MTVLSVLSEMYELSSRKLMTRVESVVTTLSSVPPKLYGRAALFTATSRYSAAGARPAGAPFPPLPPRKPWQYDQLFRF
jgi:hypothetical protein